MLAELEGVGVLVPNLKVLSDELSAKVVERDRAFEKQIERELAP